MKNIIWLVDINMAPNDPCANKVIQVANALNKRVDLVIDRRVRSTERWYWPHLLDDRNIAHDLDKRQNELADHLSKQFSAHDIELTIYQEANGDYLASLTKLLSEDELLILQADAHSIRQRVFQLANKFYCNILLLTQQPWHKPIAIAAAVDPLHENDRPAKLDHYIVNTSKSLRRDMQGTFKLTHCCFTPPVFIEHKNAILAIHRDAFEEFAKKTGVALNDTTLLNGIPEHALPDWIHRHNIDLLCLGYIARNNLENYLVGSTTYALLKSPPCDMLMVHHS